MEFSNAMGTKEFWKGSVFTIGVIAFLAVSGLIFYVYWHYLRLSWDDALLVTGSFVFGIPASLSKTRTDYRRYLYFLVVMATCVYTGVLLVRVGIVS